MTVSYHLTSVRWHISKSREHLVLAERWWQCHPLSLLLRMLSGYTSMETVWGLLKNPENKTTIRSSNSPPWHWSHKCKSLIWEDISTTLLTKVFLTIAKIWEQSRCPRTVEISRGLYAQWNSTPLQEKMKSCIWLQLGWSSGGRHAKWNESEGEGQILNDLTHLWGIKKQSKEAWGIASSAVECLSCEALGLIASTTQSEKRENKWKEGPGWWLKGWVTCSACRSPVFDACTVCFPQALLLVGLPTKTKQNKTNHFTFLALQEP